jgi:uncharacterized protein (DUF433 family)
MIEKTPILPQWSEEDPHMHPAWSKLPRRPSVGSKWTISDKTHYRPWRLESDWLTLFWGKGELKLKAKPSDDDLLQQAAAKVGHKIQIDRKILGGAPCIAGTRIPVYAILELVEAGYSHKKILKSFPSLHREDLDAALRFSVIVMER